MQVTLNQLNKFMLAFLESNSDEADQKKSWMAASNQKQVKNLLSRSTKSKKDPNAPKRGKSAYLIFCTKHRAKTTKDLGKDAKATDVTIELGKRWGILKDDKSRIAELKGYEEQAQADKERYELEKQAYEPPVTISPKQKPNEGVKKAKSAYLFFCAAKRAIVKADLGETAKQTAILTELGVRWNKLKSEDNYAEYEELAAADKERYLKAKGEKLSPDEESVPKKQAPKKQAPKKQAPKKQAPKKQVKVEPSPLKKTGKGKNGYQVFCSEKRGSYKEEFPSEGGAEITKKLSAAWKKLSKKEQDGYKGQVVV